MDQHAREYYSTHSELGVHGHFHRVIFLDEEPILDWNEASKLVPTLCRGWYELAQLSIQDRIEFIREFWLIKLPYHAQLHEFLTKFFDSLDDLGIVLTQQSYEDPFKVHLIYSLADNSGFFHGECPATESEIISLQQDFPNYILPADYLAFLQIHNGFAKLTDTGITPSTMMKESYDRFQEMIANVEEPLVTTKGVSINPVSLIPFYESFGMPFFQCFWGEWYPEQEMGNVYCSVLSRTISQCQKKEECIDTMAFQTFSDWLMFYLEKID